MRKTWLIVAGVALMGLSSCQRPAAKLSQSSTPVAVPTLAALGTPRAPGLWEQRVTVGTSVQTSRVCLDAATDRQAALAGRALNEAQCSSHTVARTPQGWRITTICNMGEAGQVTTSGLATGDFSRRYQITLDQATTGSSSDSFNGNRHLVIESALQGPCPAGMAPGQAVLADGSQGSLSQMLPAQTAAVTLPAPAAAPALRR